MGSGTRDCVLLSALGICFAVRCLPFAPDSLPGLLARFFLPSQFDCALGSDALPSNLPLGLAAHPSALVRLAVTRALLSCFDSALLAQPVVTSAGSIGTLLAFLVEALLATIADSHQANLHFLALQSLALWLRSLAPSLPRAVLLRELVVPQGQLCAQLLELVFAQWEHPIEVSAFLFRPQYTAP